MASADHQADGGPLADHLEPGMGSKSPDAASNGHSASSTTAPRGPPVWMPAAGAFRPVPAGPQETDPTEAGPRHPDSVMYRCTQGLTETYKLCSSVFHPPPPLKQQRVLTDPAEGCKNNGADNENSDLILAVDDVFQSTSGRLYVVTGMLGQGTFGQVAQCRCDSLGVDVAVKVIKNQPAYYHQAQTEIGVLQLLNQHCDPEDKRHIVRLLDFFIHKEHLCLVFELLSVNLYELVKHNQFQGLSLNLLRVLMTQILDSLVVLRDAHVIHCDLKPENVLLKGLDSGEIKVIDFGSACFENRTVYSYIQSRFYRSPEVLLGHQYTVAIDMWSFGCVAAEMFLGLPLFPGASEYDLLTRITDMLGVPPPSLLGNAKNTKNYFKLTDEGSYQLLTQTETEERVKQPAPLGKRYFKHSKLADIVGAYPMRSGMQDAELARERQQREAFLDLLLGVLDLDPVSRWTPRQAMQHPFITGEVFAGPFQPEPDHIRPLSGNSSPLQIPGGSQAASPAQNNFGVPWGPGSSGAMAGSLGASSLGNSHGGMMAGSPAQVMHAQAQAQAHAAAMAVVSQMSPRINALGRDGRSSSLPGAYGRAYVGSGPPGMAQARGVDPAAHTMLSPQQHQQHLMAYGAASNSLPGTLAADGAAYRPQQQWQQHRLQQQSTQSNLQQQADTSYRQQYHHHHPQQQQAMGTYQAGSLPSQHWHYQQQMAGSPYQTAQHYGGMPYPMHPGSLGAYPGARGADGPASYHSSQQLVGSGARPSSLQEAASSSMGTTPTQRYMQQYAHSPVMNAASMAAAMAAQNSNYSQHQAAIVAQAAAHAAAHASSFAGANQLSGSLGSHTHGAGYGSNVAAAASAAFYRSGGYHPAADQRRNSLDVATTGRQGMYGSVPMPYSFNHPGMQSQATSRAPPEASAASWQQPRSSDWQGREGGDFSFNNAARPYPEAKAVLNQRLASEPLEPDEEEDVVGSRVSPEAGDLADYLPFFSDDQLIEETEAAPSNVVQKSQSQERPGPESPISQCLPVGGMDRLALSAQPTPRQGPSGKIGSRE